MPREMFRTTCMLQTTPHAKCMSGLLDGAYPDTSVRKKKKKRKLARCRDNAYLALVQARVLVLDVLDHQAPVRTVDDDETRVDGVSASADCEQLPVRPLVRVLLPDPSHLEHVFHSTVRYRSRAAFESANPRRAGAENARGPPEEGRLRLQDAPSDPLAVDFLASRGLSLSLSRFLLAGGETPRITFDTVACRSRRVSFCIIYCRAPGKARPPLAKRPRSVRITLALALD